MCNCCALMPWSQSVVSFDIFFIYTLVCIHTHMHVYTYKCIYTCIRMYSSTIYTFYKHTHSLYIRNPREIMFQEHYICFTHRKPKLVHFLDIPSGIFSLHLFHKISPPFHLCDLDLTFSKWQHYSAILILENGGGHVHVPLVLQSPELDTTLRMWPHQC